jgi:transposase
MYLRRYLSGSKSQGRNYWKLVESHRTERGPRQRIVAYLGDVEEALRQGVKEAAQGFHDTQGNLFEPAPATQLVTVQVDKIRVERCLEFGGPWLVLQVLEHLQLPARMRELLPGDRAEVEWWAMALVLVIARVCHPSSELYIAEHFFERSSLGDLLGIAADKVNDDRLYRALDNLLPHKVALEQHLQAQLGRLFGLQYELLLYDVTSTYFEGMAQSNPQAQRGYSRDNRPDCKQVCLALVVTTSGMPLAYEVFDGNRTDVTTVEEIVTCVEARYGQVDRIWVMDRGMVSEENLEFLRHAGRRYLVGASRSQLKKFEQQLLEGTFAQVRAGVEVQLCPGPAGDETFILCRSEARRLKDHAITANAVAALTGKLERLQQSCLRRKYQVGYIERRLGRLLQQHRHVAGAFSVQVSLAPAGGAQVTWLHNQAQQDWATLTEGCYLLRSNIKDWSAEELWQTYIQLTAAESAFRIQKHDLALRPIWHQRQDRVQAHLLVCFLAYVVWKTLGRFCSLAGLGDEPRKVFDEVATLRMVDVVMPTQGGVELRRRVITEPTKAQAKLLQQLRLRPPKQIPLPANVVPKSPT